MWSCSELSTYYITIVTLMRVAGNTLTCPGMTQQVRPSPDLAPSPSPHLALALNSAPAQALITPLNIRTCWDRATSEWSLPVLAISNSLLKALLVINSLPSILNPWNFMMVLCLPDSAVVLSRHAHLCMASGQCCVQTVNIISLAAVYLQSMK